MARTGQGLGSRLHLGVADRRLSQCGVPTPVSHSWALGSWARPGGIFGPPSTFIEGCTGEGVKGVGGIRVSVCFTRPCHNTRNMPAVLLAVGPII